MRKKHSACLLLILTISTVFFLHPDCFACDDASWQWHNPLPQGLDLNDAWGSSCLHIYAVGQWGCMVRFNGYDWEVLPRGTTKDLLAIWGFSENDIYAGGDEGTLIHYDGNEWSSVPINTNNRRIHDIWGIEGILYLTGRLLSGYWQAFYRYDGVDLETIDVLAEDPPDPSIYGTRTYYEKLWGFADRNIFLGGTLGYFDQWGEISHTIGIVVHWHNDEFDTYFFDDPVMDIWGSSEDNLFVTTSTGTAHHFDGSSWKIIRGGGITWIRGSSADYVVGANAGRTYRYTGSSWIPICDTEVILTNDLAGALCVTPDSCTAVVGSRGTVTACTWYCEPRNSSSFAVGIADFWGFGENDVYAADHGSILHYDGTGWTTFATGIHALSVIWGLDSGCLYTVGGKSIAHFDGDGWTEMSFGDVTCFYDVSGISENDIYAVGYKDASPDQGIVYHYDGIGWTLLTAGLGNHCYGIAVADTNVYVAADETVYKRFNTDWIEIGSFDEIIHGICSTPEGKILAVTDYHIGYYDGFGWYVQDLSHLLVAPMRRIWASSPNDIWIAGFLGQIVHYGVGGWKNQAYLGAGFKAIWGSGPCDVFTSGSQGTILHYGEEGTTSILITSFEAWEVSGGIELSWEIHTDELIREFQIHRVDLRSGNLTVLRNASLETPRARSYTDVTAEPGVTYQYTLAAVRGDGTMVLSQPVTVTHGTIPFELHASYPNPFHQSTRIGYSMPAASHVTLCVYDAAGRRIATLVDRVQDVGYQKIVWDGRNQDGMPVGAGVYFLRLRVGEKSFTRKTVLLR